jgi:hypothetical protein
MTEAQLSRLSVRTACEDRNGGQKRQSCAKIVWALRNISLARNVNDGEKSTIHACAAADDCTKI